MKSGCHGCIPVDQGNTRAESFIHLLGKNRQNRFISDELEKVRPRLWRFCLARTAGNHADAQDLFQATAVRALERARQFKQGTRFDSWVYAIAASIWFNELRSRKVRRGSGVIDASKAGLESPCQPQEVNIFTSQVLNRVMELPESQRLAVLLVYGEGYSYRETAEILKCPVGTVMSRLAAARKAIRKWAEGGNRKAVRAEKGK